MSAVFVDVADAFQIVLELARQNIIDKSECITKELEQERERQIEACNVIEDLAVNEYGDD